jgi:sarcosine oxidase, subunit gamma
MQKERGIMSKTTSNLELNLSQFSPVMQSPLHHFGLAAKQEPVNEGKGVWANELALLGYISLRGNVQNAAFAKAAISAIGVALPTLPCSLINTLWGGVYWLSPDEWLIVCAREKRAELQQKLEVALVNIHSQVVDNSGGFTSVLLQGKNSSDALSHCTVYDLHALTAGKIVGTTFGKASVFLHRNDNGYTLIFRRSFADYIWHYLERAAAPYGFGIMDLAR